MRYRVLTMFLNLELASTVSPRASDVEHLLHMSTEEPAAHHFTGVDYCRHCDLRTMSLCLDTSQSRPGCLGSSTQRRDDNKPRLVDRS